MGIALEECLTGQLLSHCPTTVSFYDGEILVQVTIPRMQISGGGTGKINLDTFLVGIAMT